MSGKSLYIRHDENLPQASKSLELMVKVGQLKGTRYYLNIPHLLKKF